MTTESVTQRRLPWSRGLRGQDSLGPRVTRLPSVALLGPFLLFFLAFYVLPIAYAVYLSFQAVSVTGLGISPDSAATRFVGVANYARVLEDAAFLQSFRRVLLYGVVQVPVSLGIALLLALLLDSQIAKFPRFFRLAFFLPYAIPGVIAVIMWSFIYSPSFSPVLAYVQDVFPGFSFVGESTVLWAIANIATWQHTGYNMIVILAALQAVPRELQEAARVDGASGFRIAMQIKIPLVVPAIVLTMVFAIIGTLQLFSEPLVLQSIATTIPSTYTPNLVIYTNAFTGNNANYAAALAVALALVSFVLSFGFLRLVGRRSFETS